MNVNDEMLSVDQVAEQLHIKRAAALKRIQRGQIPAHKQGKAWYVLKSEWMDTIRLAKGNS